MEVILFEEYIQEFLSKLKELENRSEYFGLKIGKINFDPLSNENFKREEYKTADAESKFIERLQKKIGKLKEREAFNPGLKRTRKYVEKQLELKSYEIPTTHFADDNDFAILSDEIGESQENHVDIPINDENKPNDMEL